MDAYRIEAKKSTATSYMCRDDKGMIHHSVGMPVAYCSVTVAEA